MTRDVTMKKQTFKTFLIGTILMLSLMTVALTPVTVSSLQFGKLQAKPDWAGTPGGSNGGNGGGEGDTTTYMLNIEIDYMDGHEPTPEALDYIVGYYAARGIEVTFHADGYPDEETYTISQEVPITSKNWDASDGISDGEFAFIEDEFNDNDFGYFDNWKWILFGTTVEGEPNVVGYAWTASSRKDLLAGNYIFIADEAADNWATTEPLVIGAEVTVLMHEIGHSIGIGKLHPLFGERYDSDTGSVMSYLSVDNAGNSGSWYYSDEYWTTRNMEYYEEIVA